MKKYLLVFMLAVFTLSIGCQSDFGVSHTGIESWIKRHQANALSGSNLGVETVNYLLRTGKMDKYMSNPKKVLNEIHQKVVTTKNRKLLDVLIELCYDQAKKATDKREAISYYLSSAVYAYIYLFDKELSGTLSPYEPEFIFAVRFYNYAIALTFQYLLDHKLLLVKNFKLPFLGGTVNFLAPKNYMPHKLADFIDFKVSYEYTPTGFHDHTRQTGLGAPFTAIGKWRLEDKIPGEIFDTSKIVCPGSFFIRFDRTGRTEVEATPEYYDPLITNDIKIDDETIPLEVDLTTYLGFFLKDGPKVSPIWAMVDPGIMDKISGLYTLAPYKKGKIPVVFVHGLMSYPRTWVQMLNTLLKSAAIRKNYQFWFFSYPTVNPLLFSASKLRNALQKARRDFDPQNNDPAFDRMVLIGHSMGGLLCKLMAQTPGNIFLKRILNISSLDELNLTEEQKDFARDVAMFQSLPFVERMIFLNVPHKGSYATRWTVSVLAAKFINLPGKLVTRVDQINKRIASAVRGKNDINKIPGFTGVDNLDPENKIIQIVQDIPIDQNVTYHSIIGDNVKAKFPGGTDGIVPYDSAHLDGADSELIIMSGHSSLGKPETISEVKRILLLHLEQ